MGDENDAIPLAEPQDPTSSGQRSPVDTLSSPATSTADLQAPLHTQDPSMVTGTGGPPIPAADLVNTVPTRLRHDPPPLSRSQVWATSLTANLDFVTYIVLFTFVGLPLYYAAGYAMPIQLCINVICFLTALRIPSRYRTYLHPVLVSSAFTIVVIWIFALMRRSTLDTALKAYSTGATYTQIWDTDGNVTPPGAGDIFGSVLDVSIVALGLPMFQFRQELKTRYVTIIVPSVILSVGSLLAYPLLCYSIGISSKRSLAFASRSLTLALATPATRNLGGDLYTVAPLCIFSGITGVVIGPRALRTLRIPEGGSTHIFSEAQLTDSTDDYITRGITLGAHSSAVATALLLTSDPRAAAFSSLSMGLFGTITVALTSVPPFVTIVRGLVGL